MKQHHVFISRLIPEKSLAIIEADCQVDLWVLPLIRKGQEDN